MTVRQVPRCQLLSYDGGDEYDKVALPPATELVSRSPRYSEEPPALRGSASSSSR
jgi:hypothetical protein